MPSSPGPGTGSARRSPRRLVAEGARVVVNDLDAAACEAVAAEIGATAAPGDCSSAAGVAALVDTATSTLGRIDVFMANAGIDRTQADSLQASDEDWALMIDTNVMSHVRAARAARAAVAGRRPGRPVRGHRVRGRAADDDRRGAVLRDQARRGRLRRVAVGDVRRPRRHGPGHLPAGRADPDAGAGGPAQGPALARRGADAGGGGRHLGGLARGRPVPRAAAPRGRRATTPPARPTPTAGWPGCSGCRARSTSTWRRSS